MMASVFPRRGQRPKLTPRPASVGDVRQSYRPRQDAGYRPLAEAFRADDHQDFLFAGVGSGHYRTILAARQWRPRRSARGSKGMSANASGPGRQGPSHSQAHSREQPRRGRRRALFSGDKRGQMEYAVPHGHDFVGGHGGNCVPARKAFRQRTGRYTPAPNACMTFRVRGTVTFSTGGNGFSFRVVVAGFHAGRFRRLLFPAPPILDPPQPVKFPLDAGGQFGPYFLVGQRPIGPAFPPQNSSRQYSKASCQSAFPPSAMLTRQAPRKMRASRWGSASSSSARPVRPKMRRRPLDVRAGWQCRATGGKRRGRRR